VILVLLFVPTLIWCLDNGLARTPPMGWLDWERYRCVTDCNAFPNSCISEKLFTTMADRLVSDGYAAVGYTQVNIDDCWPAKQRNAQGQLVADPIRFPHGIKWLSDYMHARGLKLGIYEDFGNYTCGGYPGSQYHLETDANTFASWNLDMLKLDGCYTYLADMNAGYPEMEKYLNATGRPIIYSCSWPDYLRAYDWPIPWNLIQKSCNLWRVYDDIQDSWDSVVSIINYWGEAQATLAPLSAPGSWNDPDQLIIGDFSLSYDESKTQMSFWCLWAAPLLMSNDLTNISDWAREILLNREVIAVNQDPLGIQGTRISKTSDEQIWKKNLSDGSIAVILFYSGSYGYPLQMTVYFNTLGIKSGVSATVRDLWLHKDLGVFTSSFSAFVDPHGVVMVKITPKS